MATRIVKGNEVMLFDEQGKSYAFATNHTLTLTAETSNTASKDHGMWDSAEVTKLSWEIQSENIYVEAGFNDFFDKWKAGTKFKVKWGMKNDLDTGHCIAPEPIPEGTTNWQIQTAATTEQTGVYYEGYVIITSLSANANNGENATSSATFKGVGAFSKVTPA